MLAASTAIAQTNRPDVVQLGNWLAAGEMANNEKTRDYAWRSYRVRTQFDKDGKESSRTTESWEVIGLEGSAYRRLMLRDDKPLPPAEQKREDERLARETAKRKRENSEQRRNRLFATTYTLGFHAERTKDLYDLKYVKDDFVDGRAAWVVEGLPKAELRPTDANDRELLNYKVTAWVDREDHVASRVVLEVIGDHSRMRKGTVFEAEEFRNEAGAWLAKSVHIRFQLRVFKVVDVRGEDTESFSDYRRFQVDSKIVEP